MLIADISGRTLARLARRPAPGRGLPLRPAREHVEIDGTPAGTALTTQRIHVSRDEDGMWVHIPVSERGEAVGVLPPSSSSTGTAPPASYPHSCRQRTGHLKETRDDEMSPLPWGPRLVGYWDKVELSATGR